MFLERNAIYTSNSGDLYRYKRQDFVRGVYIFEIYYPIEQCGFVRYMFGGKVCLSKSDIDDLFFKEVDFGD